MLYTAHAPLVRSSARQVHDWYRCHFGLKPCAARRAFSFFPTHHPSRAAHDRLASRFRIGPRRRRLSSLGSTVPSHVGDDRSMAAAIPPHGGAVGLCPVHPGRVVGTPLWEAPTDSRDIKGGDTDYVAMRTD